MTISKKVISYSDTGFNGWSDSSASGNEHDVTEPNIMKILPQDIYMIQRPQKEKKNFFVLN